MLPGIGLRELIPWVISAISFILAIWALSANAGLRRRFRRWKQIHETADLEAIYTKTLDQVDAFRTEISRLQAEVANLHEAVERKVSTARIIRYNAFDGQGSDLSFSVALLDDHLDGVVLSSIYGREESRVYAKPIRGGSSRYALTDEERHVIQESLQGDAAQEKIPV